VAGGVTASQIRPGPGNYPPHPRLTLYKGLVALHGEGPTADLILNRWINDPYAEDQWARLLFDLYQEDAA
jgi:hypothetical protein